MRIFGGGKSRLDDRSLMVKAFDVVAGPFDLLLKGVGQIAGIRAC